MGKRAEALAFCALLLAFTSSVRGQGVVYPAGDGSTGIARGREVCGTTPLDMNALDSVSYAVAGASESAAFAPTLRVAVANPMGRDTPAASAGRWGVTVVNPTPATLTVTEVDIDCAGNAMFGALNMVQPGFGWTVIANNIVRWTGSIDVPANTSLDWIVQIQGRSLVRTDIPLAISAVTAQAGTLSRYGVVTSQTNNNSNPYVSLPFVVAGNEVFSSSGTSGSIETGQPLTLTVRVRESEAGNTRPIPAGTVLTVSIPPGFADVVRLPSGSFGADTIVQPTPCTPGSITAATAFDILNTSRDFSFTVLAPSNQGSTGYYPFSARLTSTGISPAIDTLTEFTQEVAPPPSNGMREGLTSAGVQVTVPNPMGNNRNSTWGVTFANPTASPITIETVQIYSPTGANLFKAVTPIQPASGWQRVSESFVSWTGSLTVGPHQADDFFVSLQATGAAGSSQIYAAAIDSDGATYLNTDATTSQDSGLPIANLHYLRYGQPAGVVGDVPAGEVHQFQLQVEEKQGVSIPAGSELRVVVPRGWSAVTALAQPGWSAPLVIEPTPTADGEIRSSLTSTVKSSRRGFEFSATAPAGILDSLYPFPTTLTGGPVGSLAELVVQAVDVTGGLEVQHLSPPFNDPLVNQIDVEVIATSTPPTDYRIDVYNLATSAWETLTSGDVGAAPTTLIGSVNADFADYFDDSSQVLIRLISSAPWNHRLDQDNTFFIGSYYRLLPASVAPPSAPQGRLRLPVERLRFEVDNGSVQVKSIQVEAVGTDVYADIATVHLFADADCDGIIDQPLVDLAPEQALSPTNNPVTFADGTGNPILGFDDQAPTCALVAFDLTAGAVTGDLVGAKIASGLDLTSNVGAFPFPCPAGYPIRSDDVLITASDRDLDGLTDAQELVLGTDPGDADSDDDGILDGQELGGDGVLNSGVDTDPLQADSDGDGLPDGLEEGLPGVANPTDTDGDGTPDAVDPDPVDPTIKGTDASRLVVDLDPASTTNPLDDDSDDDGILDGNEDADHNGKVDVVPGSTSSNGTGETDPGTPDSDHDGIPDGIEIGLAAPEGRGTNLAVFVADADPTTRTNPVDVDTDNDGIEDGLEDASRDGARQVGELDPLDTDSDDDGIADGLEVGPEGVQDPGETSALLADSDADGLQDGTELGLVSGVPDLDGNGPLKGTNPMVFQPDLDPATRTNPLDDDTDDDGLLDGFEDADHNGRVDHVLGGTGSAGSGETDPRKADTDGDLCQDGSESGRVAPQGSGTNMALFRPDTVPSTTTDPLDRDTDDDGIEDGAEDGNCDGGVDPGETDPAGDPSVLRNDVLAALAQAAALKPAVFTGSGACSLVLAGPDRAPGPGEGADPRANGSSDDDDLYESRATRPWTDPDAAVGDVNRPLIFYQVSAGGNTLRATRAGGAMTLDW